MAITTNFNEDPYFDDYEQNAESKGYHQILFRPGFAVQARELNQLQTVLQEQIARFGTSIFRQGSIAIPGNSYADTSATYLRIESTSGALDLSSYEGQKIRGASSGTEAKIRKVVPPTEDDPITFYIQSTGGGNEGQIDFDQGETIEVIGDGAIASAEIEDSSEYTGEGTLAFVNEGVYFVNGYFVLVESQSIVVDKYSSTPSAQILLRINESVVTPDDDVTLFDNAQGSFNFAAPGAHRYSIGLTLTSLPLSADVDEDNYVELMRYDNGELREHAKTPQYSELSKELARRTFDESGNYVVEGTYVGVREHLKGGSNRDGVFPPPKGDNDKMVVSVTAGKAYINGFEVEKLGKSRVEIDKARTDDHIKTTDLVLRPQFGQYIVAANFTDSFDLKNREEIELYNQGDPYASDSTKIGSARIVAIDFITTDPGTTGAIHKLWVSRLEFEPGFSIEDAGSIAFGVDESALVLNEYRAPVTSGSFDVGETITHSSGRSATVEFYSPTNGLLYAYRHDNSVGVPRTGDEVVSSSTDTESVIQQRQLLVTVGRKNPLIFKLNKDAPASFVNPDTSLYNLDYTVQKQLTITTDSDGNGSISAGSGEEINPIEIGTFIALGPNGLIDNSKFSLDTIGRTLTITDGPLSTTVRAYVAVTKRDISPKTKSVESSSKTFVSPGNNTLVLDDTDIISVDSIIDSTGDITANYTLDDGQRDTVYLQGSLRLNSGAATPSGDVTVNYTYYSHSISGDFFCIDSYPDDILEKDVRYRSTSEGRVFELPRCIDFRPSVGNNGEINGVGGRSNDLIISGTTFRSKLQFYVPRIDLVTMTQGGGIKVLRGTPSKNPSPASRPKNELALETIYIPEFTKSASDVTLNRLSVDRYRMKDIQDIEKRLDNVEYFITLTAQELEVTNFDVIDAGTGLNRFKTGFLVEAFKDAFLTARTTSPDYSANISGKELEAAAEQELVKLRLDNDSSSHFVNKNGYLMLPYTEEEFASQPLSSRIENLNPFLVISWDGILEVDPPVDEWVEIRDRPTVFEEEKEVKTVKNYIPCPPEPPEPEEDNDPPEPPEPVETPIGWYGATVGRDERDTPDDDGAEFWTSEAANSSAESVAERFLDSAKSNAASGDEDIFNADALDPSSVSKNDIVTGTASYDSSTNETTITGITLGGSSGSRNITKTVQGKIDQNYR